MQSGSNQNSSGQNHQESIEFKFQFQREHSPPQNTSEHWKIERKVELELYLHFERLLGTNYAHYNQQSVHYQQKVSKQKIVDETVNYLNYLRQHSRKLPPQHHQQLLLLINYFNNNNQLITNRYVIKYPDSTAPAIFWLSTLHSIYQDFIGVPERIDLKQLVGLDNWNHLLELSFYNCGWFSNEDWKLLVENADNFKSLRRLVLWNNTISEIQERDLEQFEQLEYLNLQYNPLRKQSKEVLNKLRQSHPKITIRFNE